MASVRAGALLFERRPRTGGWRTGREDCLREPALYRDDKAVDALVKTVSMATS